VVALSKRGEVMLVLDFDGTLTDVEQEGTPFTVGFLQDIARLTGWTLDRVQQRAEQIAALIAADPGSHGWKVDGVIMAPATVDPYLRIKPIAEMIFDEAGIYQDPDARRELLTGTLYSQNYQRTTMHFANGAKDLLVAIMRQELDCYIVTNSHTEPVQEKIRRMGMMLADECDTLYGAAFINWWLPRVHGRAKKYLPGGLDVEPFELRIPGLNRPVQLRRPHYFEVLNKLRNQHGITWAQVTVVGDIFELDLALPLALGGQVGLMVNEYTPAYEVNYLRTRTPYAEVMTGLDQVLPFYERSPGHPRNHW